MFGLQPGVDCLPHPLATRGSNSSLKTSVLPSRPSGTPSVRFDVPGEVIPDHNGPLGGKSLRQLCFP